MASNGVLSSHAMEITLSISDNERVESFFLFIPASFATINNVVPVLVPFFSFVKKSIASWTGFVMVCVL